jgi:Fe2+ transport system protein FeoA
MRLRDRGTLCVVDQTPTGATGRRIRVLGIVVGACLLVIAAALATLPMTIEVDGSPANCGIPAFALRAPSESDDKGFNAVEDACSGAGFGRLFKAFVFGGAGVAAIIGAQRFVRRRAAGVEEFE